jgi:outer membrane immunogenic protein
LKQLLASASAVVLGSAGALAADLPMKAAPFVAPVPVFSWTGCYIGAHVGGATMHDSFTQDNTQSARAATDDNATGSGALAGGQLGCNYQDGNAVFGLEGEGYWSGIKTTTTAISVITGEGNFQTAKNKDDFTIAARIGLAFDRTLVYGKAGWVWGRFDFESLRTCCGNVIINSVLDTSGGTLDGLLLGVGLEHAFTRNWTVKLEYNFLSFGSKALAQTECRLASPCQSGGSVSEHATKQVFKVGVNYLFDWGAAPRVARY